MRLGTLIGSAFLFLATAVNAQVPTKGNVYFGYSYVRADLAAGGSTNLNGWDASLEGKVLPLLGIVADLSGNYGGQQVPTVCGLPPCTTVRVNGSAHTFLFGPRISVSAGRFTPFAHVLIGAAHVGARGSGFSSSDTSFATALGGGLDYKLVKGVAWRFQGDYLQTRLFSSTQDNFRFTTGIVFRF